MNEKLLKKLREGTIAVKNDGTIDELNKVLKYAFPNDNSVSKGFTKYYFASKDKNYWSLYDTTNLHSHSVKEFLKSESEYQVDLNWKPEEETKPLKLTMEQIAEKFNAEKIEIVNYGK